MTDLSRREMERLRRIIRKSDINHYDRIRLEALVREYFLLVPVIRKTIPSLVKAQEEAEQFLGLLLEDAENTF